MSQDRDSLLENSDINPSTSNYFDNIESHPADITPIGPQLPPKKFPQIFAGLCACLSSLSAGIVLGWTSPILDTLTKGKYNGIAINDNQMGWIGSFVTLGAMAMCIPSGFVCDLIGRKNALLLLMIPFAGGWALIVWAKSVLALYFGRLLTGMVVGACCVAVPLYNGEIAHQNVRGALGSFFQLSIVTGIFIAYVIGRFLTPSQFTIFCASSPILFPIFFAFQPESPNYLIRRGQYEQAKKALLRLRGSDYDVDNELIQIEGSLKESIQMTSSLRDTFTQRSVKRAMLIAFSLMFFQQFCGINAIILYSSSIFKSSGANIDANDATIMMGAFQVLGTLVASLLIDKLGRKCLLFVSLSAITVMTVLLGIYFSVKTRGLPDADVLKDIGFIPVGALCLYVIAFAFGLGPIPWMISSEILPAEIRSMVSSAAGTFNWFLAFVITKTYLQISNLVGQDTMFYVFTTCSLIGALFVIALVPETKNKSIDQIQIELAQ